MAIPNVFQESHRLELSTARCAGESAAAAAAGRQLAALDAAAKSAEQQLDALSQQFRAYQEQKAAEVATLEQRLAVMLTSATAVGAHGEPVRGGGRVTTGRVGLGLGVGRRGRVRTGTGSSTSSVRRGVGGVRRGHGQLRGAAVGGGRTGTYPRDHQDFLQREGVWDRAEGHADSPAAESRSAAAAAGVVAAAAADRVAAAQRDAQWESLLRQRAEDEAASLRLAAARLRGKVREMKREQVELQQAAAAGAVAAMEVAESREEVGRLRQELAAAKESLRLVKQNGARRQRVAAAAAAAAVGGSLAGPEAMLLQSVTAAAGGGVGGLSGDDEGVGAEGLSLALAAVARELAAERAAKEGMEGKLKEAKATIDRKNNLIR